MLVAYLPTNAAVSLLGSFWITMGKFAVTFFLIFVIETVGNCSM